MSVARVAAAPSPAAAPARAPVPAPQPSPRVAPTPAAHVDPAQVHRDAAAAGPRVANDPRFSSVLRAQSAAGDPPSPPFPIQRMEAARVSSPSDPSEREAVHIAKTIVRMPAPAAVSAAPAGGAVQRAPVPRAVVNPGLLGNPFAVGRAAAPTVARQGEGRPKATPGVVSEIGAAGRGAPLPRGVRRFMEPRFKAGFGNVGIHTGPQAAKLSKKLDAHAFTVKDQVFFGKDKFQPETDEGREFIAHELTHTIQQGAVVQRSADPAVSVRAEPAVQRLFGIDLDPIKAALDWVADKANYIPGFRMFTIVLGVNPINGSAVDRSAANILRAVVEFMPGGTLITQALDKYGVFEKAGGFIEEQLATLGLVGSAIKDALMTFLHSLSLGDLLHLGDVWDRAVRIFSDPIDRIKAFVVNLAKTVIQFIKDAILKPLAELASKTAGWDLLCAVLGKNPITGDAVPRTAETLIGGFMKLIGQEEIWENIKKGNAIARAWAWFQNALEGLMGFVRQVPQLFLDALKSLEITDIIVLPLAFVKVGRAFAGFAARFLSWAGNTIWDLLEIIFSVVAPSVITYLKKARAAFKKILKDPIGFVGNLVAAGKLGFLNFGKNFVTHLKTSLINWLTGALGSAGVYIPTAFTLVEIGKCVLSVLGISWGQIRGKIVKTLGPNGETIMGALEKTFDVVKALVTGGPAAAWEVIKQKLTDLKDMVVDGIISFVKDRIITKAVTMIVSLLNPAGAFIQAVIAIYNGVMVFIERLKQIAAVVAAFIDSISAIANGQIAGAAAKVEQTMAGLLTLVIAFLARFAGLGNVTAKIVELIKNVQVKVDQALDKAITWLIDKAKGLFKSLFGKGKPDTMTEAEKSRDLKAAMDAATQEAHKPGMNRRKIGNVLRQLQSRYRLGLLVAEPVGKDRWRIHGEVNPKSYSEPLPDLMSEEDAVNALKNRQHEIRVESLDVALRVIRRVFGKLALELPEPGPGAGPSDRGSGYTGQNEAMNSFRTMKERLLAYHTDVKTFKVADIVGWFAKERARLRTGIDTAQTNLANAGAVQTSNPNDLINSINASIVSSRNRLEELNRLEGAFNAHRSDYEKLEKEEVLYGHQGLEPGHPHRRVPHINLEGRIYYGTPQEEYIDATIYVTPK